jgi:formylglycine-generating enzyme required for sulfatase activity
LNSGAGGYWSYPTKSNNAPSNAKSTTGTNNANYYNAYNGAFTDPTNYLTPVGYFAGSPGPYGTYDMGGDVEQWNEANISNTYRGLRGGSFDGWPLPASSSRAGLIPTNEYNKYDVGFRVAGTPEPGSITLLVAGAIAGLMCWRRWR